jgi:hypothetical protein
MTDNLEGFKGTPLGGFKTWEAKKEVLKALDTAFAALESVPEPEFSGVLDDPKAPQFAEVRRLCNEAEVPCPGIWFSDWGSFGNSILSYGKPPGMPREIADMLDATYGKGEW